MDITYLPQKDKMRVAIGNVASNRGYTRADLDIPGQGVQIHTNANRKSLYKGLRQCDHTPGSRVKIELNF